MIEIVRYAFFNTYVFKTHHVENPNTLNSAQIANQAKWPTLPDVLKEAEIMMNINNPRIQQHGLFQQNYFTGFDKCLSSC